VPQNYSFFRVSDQIDTGNVLIKRDVFQTIGLFDRQFEKQRMGDGEYGLRAYLEGFLNVSNPYAKRLHLKVGTGGLRQMGSWDGFRPKKFF
jgi:GT2 family glycosyltransferase